MVDLALYRRCGNMHKVRNYRSIKVLMTTLLSPISRGGTCVNLGLHGITLILKKKEDF